MRSGLFWLTCNGRITPRSVGIYFMLWMCSGMCAETTLLHDVLILHHTLLCGTQPHTMLCRLLSGWVWFLCQVPARSCAVKTWVKQEIQLKRLAHWFTKDCSPEQCLLGLFYCHYWSPQLLINSLDLPIEKFIPCQTFNAARVEWNLHVQHRVSHLPDIFFLVEAWHYFL